MSRLTAADLAAIDAVAEALPPLTDEQLEALAAITVNAREQRRLEAAS